MKTFAKLLYCVAILFVVSCNNVAPKVEEKSIGDELLLMNYDPHSIFVLEEASLTKAKYPVIDMHSHAYVDNVADIEKWVKTMDENNIEKVIIHTGAYGEKFDKLYDLYKGVSDRFEMWCGFDMSSWGTPDFPTAAIAELERCYKKGAKGVGELSDKGMGERQSRKVSEPGLHFDSDEFIPLFSKCAELGMPVNMHLADPAWMYEPLDKHNDGYPNAIDWAIDMTTPGIIGLKELVKTCENCCDKNPNTIFIACHFINLSHDYSWLSQVMDSHSNLYIDNSARFIETAATPRATKKFYEKYADRIFFGTDNDPENSMYDLNWRIMETQDEHFYGGSYHWPCHGLDLGDIILKKIYRDNYAVLQNKLSK